MDAGDVVYGAVSTTPIALMSVILQSDPEWVMKYAEEPVVFVEPSTPLMRDKYTLLWQLGASEDALFHEDGWHRLNLNKQAQSLWHSVIELCATVLQSHAMPSDEQGVGQRKRGGARHDGRIESCIEPLRRRLSVPRQHVLKPVVAA